MLSIYVIDFPTKSTPSTLLERLSTGVTGLDGILAGGLVSEQSYMVRGRAGSGKTIRGLQFLDAGMANGETGLFIEMDAIVRLTRLKTRVCARTTCQHFRGGAPDLKERTE